MPLKLERDNAEGILMQRIFVIRGHKVMIDADLAELYGVTTGNFNLAVQRNADRFPDDFMFQLSADEYQSLILQIARSKEGRGGRRHLPYAFTEHGVAMLSAVLNSEQAIQMSIFIVRAFIKMREMLTINKNLELALWEFRTGLQKQGKDIDEIIERLDRLTNDPIKPLGPVGFRP